MALSYQPDLPAGAAIIVIAGTVYLLSTVYKELKIRRQKHPATNP